MLLQAPCTVSCVVSCAGARRGTLGHLTQHGTASLALLHGGEPLASNCVVLLIPGRIQRLSRVEILGVHCP